MSELTREVRGPGARGPARRVLVFGVPRSGTTWTAAVLGATPGTRLFNEPDIPYAGPFAVRATQGIGPALLLVPGDRAPDAFERLWTALLGGGPARRLRGPNGLAHRLYRKVPVPERRAVARPGGPVPSRRLRLAMWCSQPPRVPPDAPIVVKTVVGVLAAGWLIDRFAPTAVWVRRHPLDVLGSWDGMGMLVDHLPALTERLQRTGRWPAWAPPVPDAADDFVAKAWYVGFAMSWCRAVAAEHPSVIEVAHEELCADPVAGFRDLAARSGLAWGPDAEDRIAELDTPGDGWAPRRVTADQPGKWRRRIDADRRRVALDVLGRFPVAEDYDLG